MERIRTLIVVVSSLLTSQTEYTYSVQSPVFKTQTNKCITENPHVSFFDKYSDTIQTGIFPLTDRGKKTILQIRQEQTPTNFMDPSLDGTYVCAGYLYELTERLRGTTSAGYIGMLNPHTRKPADARELPYTYRYRGGKVSYDLGNRIGQILKKQPDSYRDIATHEDILHFFAQARQTKNHFGDIGFLYTTTNFIDQLGTFGNYNSHIAKNMGVATITKTAKKDQSIQDILGCTDRTRQHIKKVLPHYDRSINEQPTFVDKNGNFLVKKDICYETHTFKAGDTITYDDIILAHFFESERIDGLLEFVCQGSFGPINIVNINTSFLEKI